MTRTMVGYGAFLAIGIVMFYRIRSAGTQLSVLSPTPNQVLFGQTSSLAQLETLLHLLLPLVVIIIAARMVGCMFRRPAQPAVIGAVIAGMLLGPSLLAPSLPELHAYLLPATINPPNIGYDLKVLSPTQFTMLVLMAVVTTLMTTPVLELLQKEKRAAVHAPLAETQ